MSKGWGEGTSVPLLDGSCDGLEFFLARLQRKHVSHKSILVTGVMGNHVIPCSRDTLPATQEPVPVPTLCAKWLAICALGWAGGVDRLREFHPGQRTSVMAYLWVVGRGREVKKSIYRLGVKNPLGLGSSAVFTPAQIGCRAQLPGSRRYGEREEQRRKVFIKKSKKKKWKTVDLGFARIRDQDSRTPVP